MYIGARGQFHLPERRPYGQLRRCPVRGTTDFGPALAWRFATRSLAMETCIAHVFLCGVAPKNGQSLRVLVTGCNAHCLCYCLTYTTVYVP